MISGTAFAAERRALRLIALVLLAALSGASQAQRTDEDAENVYMTGAEVEPPGPVNGDLMAAAGRISLSHPVEGDAVLAAGSIEMRSRIGDDLRAAGGIVTLAGRVQGETMIAGGSVAFSPQAEINGRAWIAGGEVAIAGRFRNGLAVYARNIVVLADIAGHVRITGETIEILPTTRIDGNLAYASGGEIKIHPGAIITGRITREPGTFAPWRSRLDLPGWPPFRPLLMSGLLAAGALLLALFPRFSASAAQSVGALPLKSLGLGTAIFFSVPPVMVLLVITIIGIPIALVLAGLYAAALLAGFLIAASFIGERLAHLARRRPVTGYWGRVAALAAALLLLWLVRYVPYVGGYLILLTLITGIGGMALQAVSSYARRA